MIIVVNGLLEFNAGKTSLVRAVLHRALEQGEDFLAMKPRSAHNYWEHIDHSKVCESLGILVSRDALQLRESIRKPPDLEVMNPYHQLVCPLDPLKAEEVGEHLIGQDREIILAERLTDPGRGVILYVNERADHSIAPAGFIEALSRHAQQVQTLRASSAVERTARVEVCVRSAFEMLSGNAENLIVESFSDAPFPLKLAEEEVDLVISVGGSLVLFIEPEDVLKAMSVVKGVGMPGLVRYIRPKAVFRVPHLSSEERRDGKTLAKAYDEVLRYLWEWF